jgi:hypothetical protein
MSARNIVPMLEPEQPLRIATQKGPLTIPAHVVRGTNGTLAVHTLAVHRGEWTVTHVPTGLRIPHGSSTRFDALCVACVVWQVAQAAGISLESADLEHKSLGKALEPYLVCREQDEEGRA